MCYSVFLALCLLFLSICQCEEYAMDPNGYIVYCPCLGRFGNQADHFVGSLAFAKAMDRTLVLPPWIEYTKKTRISFVESRFLGEDLCWDIENGHNWKYKWDKSYPPEKFPVLAFTTAPAKFPVEKENVHLAQYMHWSTDIDDRAKDYIKKILPKGPFIGIHLRRAKEWATACRVSPMSGHVFSSAQCLGYALQYGKVTKQLCLPTWEQITEQIIETAKRMGAKSVFVSADKQPMLDELNTAMKPLKIQAYSVSDGAVHVSLAILTKADHFIGNCLSSFTAFVKRYRDSRHTNTQMPSSFWNFHNGRNVKSTAGVRQGGSKVEL